MIKGLLLPIFDDASRGIGFICLSCLSLAGSVIIPKFCGGPNLDDVVQIPKLLGWGCFS